MALKEDDVVEESKEPIKDTLRGKTELEKLDQSNYILIYGSSPKFGIVLDTKLIKDVMDCFT
jgi:hypothetical protein